MLSALLLCALQIPSVGDLTPDYFELGYGFWDSGPVGSTRGGQREGDRVDVRLGWLLGAPGPSADEKDAWRALRDANMQRDRMIELEREMVAGLHSLAVKLESVSPREELLPRVRAPPEEPEEDDSPSDPMMTAVITLVGIILAWIRGPQGVALFGRLLGESPPLDST